MPLSNRSLRCGWLLFLLCLAAIPIPAQVLINEIHYRPASDSVSEEFIELWNFGSEPVSLNGWQLNVGVRFSFSKITLPPDSGLVVAADAARFAELHPGVKNVVGDWQGQLANNGESIRLVNATGATMDKVRYATEGDWAQRIRGSLHGSHRGWAWHAAHDGGGHSLELMQFGLSNNHGGNWRTSLPKRGTPGRANSTKTVNLPPMILDVIHSPATPRSTDPVRVTARLIDESPDEISARLVYRLDGEGNYWELPMARSGAEQFAATIPEQPDGQVIEFYVSATDGQGVARTWPSAPSDCPRLLYQVDDQVVAPGRPVHRVILTKRERAELAEIGRRPWHNTSDAQMSGTFINIEGGRTRVRYNVGVRLRGSTSRAATQKSRRVNFPNDRPWRDRTAINLNALHPHVQELGSTLFRLAGLPAPRARAVRVFENNEQLGDESQFGHYVELDPLNSEYIRWQFPNDAGGNLYKGGGYADLKFLGDDPAPYAEKYFYAKQSNAWQNDYTDLIDFLRALSQVDGDALPEELSTKMNFDGWMRHLAIHDLLGNEETGLVTGDRGDYALYAGAIDQRFALVPYDLDAVLGVQGGEKSPLWRATANPVLERLTGHPTVAARYWFHLDDLAQTVFTPEQLDPVIDRLVGDYLPRAEIDRLKSFAAKRREFVLSQIPRELTVATGLAKRDGFFVSDPPTLNLSGQAPATETVALEANGQVANWFGQKGTWQAKLTLRHGLNRVFVHALDANGNEVARQHADVWHGSASAKPLGQRLTKTTRWTADEPLLVTESLLVPKGVTLSVDPGATVCFGPKGRLLVEGRLAAEGTKTARIQFLLTPGSNRAWGGIGFSDSADDNRLAHVDFHHTGSYALTVTNSVVTLDHVQWHGTRTNLIWFQDASLTVRDCVFPDLSHSEHVRGIGIREGGELVFARNRFGGTTGYNDILDVSGGKRPGPILQVYDNEFLGGSDDALDLDGMDAHIEGNTFHGFHKGNLSTGISAVLASGRHDGQASDITVVRNIFYDNDHHILLKEGGRLEAANNTFYGSRLGAIAFDEPDRKVEMPKGARLVGNIFSANRVDLIHLKSSWVENNWVWLHVFDSIIRKTHDWYGERSIEVDPMFSGTSADFRLQPGSPAIGTGPNGLDMGALVPVGASISGEPRTPTRGTNATLTVGGPGITHYRYRVNDGPLGGEHPIAEPIRLAKLPPGEIAVEVIGKNSAGAWQPLSQASRSKSWTVAPNHSRLVINEVLAWPSGDAPDQIELFNDSTAAADLGGMSLTDNPAKPRKFIFSAGVQVAAGAYLVLGSELGFKLDADGEGVWLFDSTGERLDSVEFGPQLEGHSIGRTGRTGDWTLTRPTLGGLNGAIALGQTDAVRVASWVANPPAGERDAIELANPGALPVALDGMRLSSQPIGAPAMFVFPPLSFIGATTELTLDSSMLSFKLSAAQGEIGLASADGRWLEHIVYGPQSTGGGLAEHPGVIISEVMSDNRTTLADEDGDFPDWIELHNRADALVSLDGFGLSDDPAEPFKWRFPDTELAPGEHLLVFASGKDRQTREIPRSPNPEVINLPANIPGLKLWLDATDTSTLTLDEQDRVARWQSKVGQPTMPPLGQADPIDPGKLDGLLLWLDAADVETLETENGRVTLWKDKSGRDNDASQPEENRQPALQEPDKDQPAIVMDGQDDVLHFNRLDNIRTVFWVLAEAKKSAAGYRPLLGDIETFHFARSYDGALFHNGPDSHAAHGQSWINGERVDPRRAVPPVERLGLVATITSKPSSASNLASDRFLPGRNWHGRIAEVLVYDRPLNTKTRRAIENHLVDKWGLAADYLPRVGRSATQSNTDQQPRLASEPLTGLPVLWFDGFDDYLSFPQMSNAQTEFVVAREDAHATKSYRTVLGDIKTTDFTRGSDRILYYPHGAFAKTNTLVRVNGMDVNPTATRWPESLCLVTSVADTGLRVGLIGTDRLIPDRNWYGDIAEILIYDHKLNQDEIVRVETWLKTKWGLPAAMLHTNFKLSPGVDTVFLTSPLGQRINQLPLPLCPPDATVGFVPDAIGRFFFSEPTPGAANRTKPHSGWLGAPRLAKPSGLYPEPVDLRITSPDSLSELRFTLDGSIPGRRDRLYAGPIRLTKPAVVRARAFREGFLPGPVATGSFLIGEKSRLPIASIVTSPRNLFDPDHGIYTEGRDYLNLVQDPVYNFNHEWERPAFFEWFEPDGSQPIGQEIGLRIHGGWSRNYYQKSLRLYARPRYGKSKFDYRIFPDLGFDQFKRLILRNSSNDWKRAFMRDAVGHELTARMGLDYQAWRPSIVYLNGRFWGIHNLRERIDSHYLASRHGIDESEVDLVQNTVMAGDLLHWNKVISFLATWNEITLDQRLYQLDELVNVDNLINYVIVEVFLANTDWPLNNVRKWRPRHANGKWQWIPYDLDGILGVLNQSPSENTFRHKVLSFTHVDRAVFIEIIQKILAEEKGRQRFAHRFTTHMQTTLSEEHILRAIDSKQTALMPEMARHIDRWRMDPAAGENEEIEEEWSLPIRNIDEWLAEVQKLRDYAMARHTHVWEHLQTDLDLDTPATLQIDAAKPGLLDVKVEGLSMPKNGNKWSARFFTNLPMQLSLRLAKGWRLVGWENNTGLDDNGRFTLTRDTTLRPHLVFDLNPDLRPLIQSINLVKGNQLTIVFQGIAGHTHHVESSTDLTKWHRLQDILVPDHETLRASFSGNSGSTIRFFRIVIDPD